MKKLIYVGNEWIDSIDASKIDGAVRRIEVEEVWCAINRMKIGKASGPSGVALGFFKAGGDKCLKSLASIFNDTFFENKLLEEWMLSSFVSIFKGKRNPCIQTLIGEQSCWNMLLNCMRRFWMSVCVSW